MSHVRVKICGITTAEDACAAAEFGADAVGLNFYERSSRYVAPNIAAAILRAVPPLVDAVGVFVGLKTRQVCAMAYQLGLRGVQCFGDMNDIEDSFPFRRIAAFRVKDRSSLDEIDRYLDKCDQSGVMPAAVIVDAHVQ